MQIERTEKYFELLNDLKEKIRHAKVTAAISVNYQLLSTYWSIGKTILAYQKIKDGGQK